MTKEKSSQEEQEKDAQSVLEQNLRFYNQGRSVPNDALKKILAGRLKGMSDINPMWRMKRLTEMFGPVGIGWKYTIDRQWAEAYGNEVKVFCNISLYVLDPETKEWSAAIPGVGGSAIVSMERSGAYVNDEAYKMALTDALSIAMKPLGIGADIWYGEQATGHNESKYEQYTIAANVQPQALPLNEALEDLGKCTTPEQVNAVWEKWRAKAPGLCVSGSEFYNVACAKKNGLKAQAK